MMKQLTLVLSAAVLFGLVTPPAARAGNLLFNPSFETVGPNGSPTTFTGILGGGPSAAADWGVYNNNFGTTTTELLPTTLPGGGTLMIHVTTTEPYNGLFEQFLPVNTGPAQTISSAWVFVLSGQVGIGTGNDGNTGLDTFSSTTGQWQFLQAPNGVSPANEMIIYASSTGGADFYADLASVDAIPEPASLTLLGLGAIGLGGYARRRRKVLD